METEKKNRGNEGLREGGGDFWFKDYIVYV